MKQGRDLGLNVINPKETDVLQYILENTENEGVEIVVEASGNQAAANLITSVAGVRGEILLLSVFKEPGTLDLRSVNFKEQSIIGSRVYRALDFKDAVEYVSQKQELLLPVISHVKPLLEGQEVSQEIISGRTNTLKVLLEI